MVVLFLSLLHNTMLGAQVLKSPASSLCVESIGLFDPDIIIYVRPFQNIPKMLRYSLNGSCSAMFTNLVSSASAQVYGADRAVTLFYMTSATLGVSVSLL